MAKEHHYKTTVTWTGNRGDGTTNYAAYDRNYTISIENKPDLPGSSDVAFRGDGTKHNPEDLLLSSLSICHMLWYLHLCADAGIVVLDYKDNAIATMIENPGGGGRFTEATLQPLIVIKDKSQIEKAISLHAEANKKCFIANSCNFPVKHVSEVS
ncbi:MAG: OsmC family protein [Bacteroidia bacterium]|nr:OsmC family protein [Bacteroidia bacterium]